MASACRGHRGHCEPWWTLSLHEQPLSFLWLILGLRLAMGPLGSHPVFIPMSSFSVNLFSFWGGRVGNEHLENQKAGFCFIDQAKLREVGEAVIWALTAISY